MAQAIPAISLVVSTLGTAYNIYSTAQAANEAEDIAEANARRIEMENEEAARRAEKEKERELSMGRARAVASGLALGGSSEIVLADLERTRDQEITWLRRSGRSQASIARQEGGLAKTRGYASAAGQFGQGVMNTYGWYETYVK